MISFVVVGGAIGFFVGFGGVIGFVLLVLVVSCDSFVGFGGVI